MSDLLRDEQHDTTRDITAFLRSECFLCGKPIGLDPIQFGVPGDLSLFLDCHGECLNGRPVSEVAKEYHRRIHDLANVKRIH